MNRDRGRFARALAGVLAIFACGKSTPTSVESGPPSPRPAIKILAFGDSLTAGKDLGDPDREAYPAVLENLLKKEGNSVSVTNAGRSGDTTFDALARLDFSLAEKPQVVIVALGSNDTFQGKKIPDIERNLEETVRRCHDQGAEVILCGMKTFPNLGPYYASNYAKIFKRVAVRNKIVLVPFLLEGVAGDPRMNLSDQIHPNVLGHERMAQTILPYVKKVLKKRIQ